MKPSASTSPAWCAARPAAATASTRPRNPYRPFCSERCKNMDLGAWASEELPRPPEPPPAFGEKEDGGAARRLSLGSLIRVRRASSVNAALLAANHRSTGTVPGSTGCTCTGSVPGQRWPSCIWSSPLQSKTLQKFSRTSVRVVDALHPPGWTAPIVMPISSCSSRAAPAPRSRRARPCRREFPVARVHLARRARGQQEAPSARSARPRATSLRSGPPSRGGASSTEPPLTRGAGRRSRGRTGRPRGRSATRAPAPRPAPPAAPPRSPPRRRRSAAQPLRRDRQVFLLAEGIEAHPQAEALRQRDLLLHHLAGMHLAVLGVRVAEVLLHVLGQQVAAVAGGVDQHVVAWLRRPSRRGWTSAPCSRARPRRSSGRRRTR